ncbi:hypothetical protein [Butyrivibrio sp. INlla14]|uniref:hypothetical protein n=1 Tax=Butyrivibrio sp. INlla14 TaxID=1520808 RepID=UPI000875F5A5|nr:hypothetical protein [Butyrivibrio sp. INlla14]SCY46922.1 hypothetical protein SAMN02910371_02415 [Butyrivibrio sp. INlla14]
MGEYKLVFDRLMDQLYNHPEEMREKLLAKCDYSSDTHEERRPQTAIEMLRSMR